MSYVVKEIYYTLQGEGVQVGRPAVFVRFTGCNLWSGHESDRGQGPGMCSAWCDTDFLGTDGAGGGHYRTAKAVTNVVARKWPMGTSSRPFVVCTGGEPLLQLDESLVAELRSRDFEVAIETNGTLMPPVGIDWICVSPKAGSTLVLRVGQELKFIFPQATAEPDQYEDLDFGHFLLQPLDGPTREENMRMAVEYCLHHPKWRLSLQTHKFLGIR